MSSFIEHMNSILVYFDVNESNNIVIAMDISFDACPLKWGRLIDLVVFIIVRLAFDLFNAF